MTYKQQALVCTSDDHGQGKAVYLEDIDGKVSKKTRKFSSPEELNQIYEQFGFDQSLPEVDNFFNFSTRAPFSLIGDLADNFFAHRQLPADNSQAQKWLPEGVDLAKHQKRLQELRAKKQEARANIQKLEEQKSFLKSELGYLQEMHSELKEGGDAEGAKALKEDLEKIEAKVKELDKQITQSQ
jgi:hypothetical protein